MTGARISRRINVRWSFVGGLDVSKLVRMGRVGFEAPGVIIVDGRAFEVGALAGFDVRL